MAKVLVTGRASNLNPQARLYQMDIRDPKIRDIFESEKPDYSHHAAQMDARHSVAYFRKSERVV